LQKIDYNAEFIKLRYILESKNLAKIWVYVGRDAFGSASCTAPDAQAYVVNTLTIPEIRICIEDEENNTYKNAVVNLLHEYGHVLDDKRYRKSKRYKLYAKYCPTGSFSTLVDQAKYIKVAMAKTEYMAHEYGKKIAKKFNILVDDDIINLDQTTFYQSNYTRLVYGRGLKEENSIPTEWNYYGNFFKRTGIRVTALNVDRLDNLLPEDYYK